MYTHEENSLNAPSLYAEVALPVVRVGLGLPVWRIGM